MLTLALDGIGTAEKENKKTQEETNIENTVMTTKNLKQLVFKPFNLMLDPTVSCFKNLTSQLETDEQNACDSFVLSGSLK